MQTTLEEIRAHSPCVDGWTKLLAHLGKTKPDSEPLALSTVLGSNGLSDALWCLRAVEGFEREMRLYAVWCMRQVQHLLTDPRSLKAIEVAERFANGRASEAELASASSASYAVSASASVAAAAASYAAAASASYAASVAAYASASSASSAAAQAQIQELKRVLACTEAGINPYPPQKD